MKVVEDDIMSLFDEIQNYKPLNQQEEYDKEQMLQFIRCNKDATEVEQRSSNS